MADKRRNSESSAKVLLAIVESYRKRMQDPKLSLSAISLGALSDCGDRGDRQLLARWTKPGARENWRIPLRRVYEAARYLEASEHETDRLMVARLQELEDVEDPTGAVAAVTWALDLAQRAQSDEQRLVLDALATARKGWAPQIDLTLISNAARQGLIEKVEQLLHAAVEELQAALQDEPTTEVDQAALRVKQQELLRSMRARNAKTVASPSTPRLRGEPRPSKNRRRRDALRAARAAIKACQANARSVVDKG